MSRQADGCPVRMAVGNELIEISFGNGFTPGDVAAIKSVPGRRWDPERRAWFVPNRPESIQAIESRFGARVVRSGAAGASAAAGAAAAADAVDVARADGAETAADGVGADGPQRDRKAHDKADPTEALLSRMREQLTLRGYSRRTHKVYLGHARRFLQWEAEAGAQGGVSSSERVERYLFHLVEERKASRAYHTQVVSALRFLYEAVLGQPRVAQTIPRPKPKRRLPDVLSKQEVARLLVQARHPKHRAILMLAYSAGLRVGEVVRLRPRDLDVDRGLVRVRDAKGGKDRCTLLSARALEAVTLYRKAFPPKPDVRWLFPGTRPGRHYTSRSVQRIVRMCATRAGIDKPVTTHTLRHSFATHLLESGTGLRYIQEFLGHSSSRTTEIYTHVTSAQVARIRSPLDELE